MFEAGKYVRFQKVDRGPDVYNAHVLVEREVFGFIRQRRGGPFEVYNRRNQLIVTGESLLQVRQRVWDYYKEHAASTADVLSA